MTATRIGEASNPGPKNDRENFRISFVNPTTILHRAADLMRLQSDVVALAETSATRPVQNKVAQACRPQGYSCCFSPPVDSQKQRLDGEVSLRGLASGTGFISRLPIRDHRNSQFVSQHHKTRLHFVHVQFGATTILIGVLYGYQQNIPGAVGYTNTLLQEACDVLFDHKGPAILMGDFNHDLSKLDATASLSEAGFRHSLQIHKDLYQRDMPATFQESSTRDLAFFSSELAGLITNIQVCNASPFPGHHPVTYELQLPQGGLTKKMWRCPKNFVELQINPALIEQQYQTMPRCLPSGEPMQDLQNWSAKIEESLDRAIRHQHALDPIRQPYNHLPKEYRGRCVPPQLTTHRFRSFAPKARHGDFDPEGEVRSIKATQLLRQVRRLESLRRRVEKTIKYPEIYEHTRYTLEQEWTAILKAKGFGMPFDRWVCQELQWTFLPRYLPQLDRICALEEIVKLAFQEKYRRDEKLHQQTQHVKIAHDHKYGHDRETYKAIKEPPKQFIQGMWLSEAISCDLYRYEADDKVIAINLNQSHLEIGCRAFLGSHEGTIVDLQGQFITLQFEELMPDFPDHFTLHTKKFGLEPAHIHQALANYWSPIWQRDTSFQPSLDDSDFQQYLDQLQMPKLCEPFNLDDLHDWITALRSLNSDSAPGADGWYFSELQSIPIEAINELKDILTQPDFHGFDESYMKARVVSLPKKEDVSEPSETRPITILPSVYRLWTTVFSQVAMKEAHNRLPRELTGLIKGRGGPDSMYDLAIAIEKSHNEGQALSGLTLDLTKAFNQFPREKVASILKYLGLPKHVVHSWIESLGHMRRHFDHRGWISEGIHSTTGVAEGDSASIIAMLGVALYWVTHLKKYGACVRAYADNLSWCAPHFHIHENCLQETVRIFREFGIPIDWNKTWVWCAQTTQRKKWQDLAERHLDGQQLLFVNSSTDLGVVVNYGKSKRLLDIPKRLQQAQDRLERLYKLNLSVPTAAKIIQTAIWTKAFYCTEIALLGKSHFQELRNRAAQVLTHTRQPGVAALAVHLAHSTLVDPEVYVIQQALRSARKLALRISRSDRQTFYHLASHASSSNGQVRGPASALKGYLERVGWQLNKQGELITAIGLKLHLENTPFPTIQNILYQDWMRELIPMTSSRKSLKGAPIPDRKLTAQVLNSIDPHAQRGILREIAQSYQLETQKAKWAADTDGSCKWCSQVDTKKHRHCLCPAMQSVYNQFPETIDTLRDLDEINCNLPVVYLPNFYDFHQHVHHQFLQVHITDAAEHLVALKQERGVMPIFFSDGSCDHPEAVSVSKASWAIIALVPDSISQLEEGIQVGKGIQQYHDQFVTVAVSACHGEQTINRAELQAAVALQEAWDDTCLITDSSYVISCFDLVRSIETPEELAFRANSDLLYRLYKVNHNGWGRNNIMIKVQSHTWRNGEPTNERLGHSLGNELADEQAKRANKELDMSFYQSVQEDAKTTLTEIKLRRGHYKLLAELHARQTKMTDKTYEDLSISATACLSHAQKPIWAILGDHQPQFGYHIDVFWPHNVSLETAWTEEVASEVIQWWQTIFWPLPPYDEVAKMGVSWCELCLSFMLDRGTTIPTRIPHGEEMQFDLQLVKQSGTGFYHTIKSFYWLCSLLNRRLSGNLFRDLQRGEVTVLQKQGSSNRTNGFCVRPFFPQQKTVAEVLRKYRAKHGRYGGLTEWPDLGDSFWSQLFTP